MRRTITMIALLTIMAAMNADAQDALIRFDKERIVGEIDPNIYGVFMEPIGRRDGSNIVYGPLYDPESPYANEDGFNTRIIDAMRELKIPNMRWPGGNYTSNYNWMDGIGPKEDRPVRIDPAWGGKDINHVGTDEWVALNRAIGSENVVCLNFGFGNLDDSRFWLEYCNFPTGTYYSDLRAEYGNPEPFNIKYWCLGNEVDGKPWIMGHKNAEDYSKAAYEVGKLFRVLDPSVMLVASGSSWYENSPNGVTPRGQWIDWNHTVIKELYGLADYLSIHRYWEYYSDDYYVMMADNVMDVEEKIDVTRNLLDIERVNYPAKRRMYISFDEWAANGSSGMAQALGNAQFLNAFVRNSDVVKMANFTMMTSILSTDRNTGETYRGPFFHIYKLFSNNALGKTIDSHVRCRTFDGNVYKDVPLLNVTCVLSPDGKDVVINVINVSKDDAITADIEAVSGEYENTAEIRTVAHGIDERFTIEKAEEYFPEITSGKVRNGKLTHTFPALSFTQICIPVK